MASALESLYKAHSTPSDLVPEDLFNGIVRTLDSAVSSDFQTEYPELCKLIHDNNEVFAAFKVHDQCGRMAQLLTDDEGNLLSFDEWKKLAGPISTHHNKVWLRTEYDTAVKRAEQARQWKQFEEERDVLPNLRWVPSTAAHPGADHMPFWNTVLPMDNPFWARHKPGDRWGCQCSLEATDDNATPVPEGGEADFPAPGLDNNPAKDGKLFSDSHPYYPSSCSTCPFNTGRTASGTPTNKVRDCASCSMLSHCVEHIGCIEDSKYGSRLLISKTADQSEINDNVKAAGTLLDSFRDMRIKIQKHVLEHNVKNPEYVINGLVADRKGIKSPDGIAYGFKRAITQGCQAVVIDFDMHLRGKNVKMNKVARGIHNRYRDFESGTIRECYVIHNGKAIRITEDNLETSQIEEELKKISRE